MYWRVFLKVLLYLKKAESHTSAGRSLELISSNVLKESEYDFRKYCLKKYSLLYFEKNHVYYRLSFKFKWKKYFIFFSRTRIQPYIICPPDKGKEIITMIIC